MTRPEPRTWMRTPEAYATALVRETLALGHVPDAQAIGDEAAMEPRDVAAIIARETAAKPAPAPRLAPVPAVEAKPKPAPAPKAAPKPVAKPAAEVDWRANLDHPSPKVRKLAARAESVLRTLGEVVAEYDGNAEARALGAQAAELRRQLAEVEARLGGTGPVCVDCGRRFPSSQAAATHRTRSHRTT